MERMFRRLRLLARRRRAEQSMDDEIRHHLELEAAALVEQGLTPDAARREARRRFGGIEQVKEAARDARGTRGAEDLAADLRYAMRLLPRNPGVTFASIATFAVAISSTTAILSLAYGVLLRPLPYADPGRLVVVWERDVAHDRDANVVSLDNFEVWRDRARSFTSMAAVIPTSATFTDGPEPERVIGAEITAGYFALLGVQPMLGRDFDAGDRAGLAILLSHGYWTRRFGGDPAVIGRVRTISGRPYTIVGVMPPVEPPRLGWLDRQDVWFPMPTTAERRNWGRSLIVLARLRDGVTLAQARDDMNALTARLETENPADRGWSASVVPLMEEMTGRARPSLMALLGGVSILLAMAIANVGMLTLSGIRRKRDELAVRRAIGATDWRLFRHLFMQAALLAVIGTGAGLAAAPVAVRLLVAVLPPDTPRLTAIAVDAPVLVLSSIIAALATAGVGVAAGLSGRRAAATSPLTRASGGVRATSRTDGGSLVVIEIAMALSLAAMAMLMARSLAALGAVDLGFEPRDAVVARVALPRDRYASPDAQRAFFDQLLDQVRAIPGVSAAGVISARPMGGVGPATTVHDTGAARADAAPVVDVRVLDGGALEALGMRVLAGRSFEATVNGTGPVPVIVTKDLADRFWPGESAIGRHLRAPIYGELSGTIVAVVPSIHLLDARTPARPAMFLPASRFPDSQRDLIVRSAGSPEVLVPRLRSIVAGLDRSVPLYQVGTLPQLLGQAMATDRFITALLCAFAGAALLLAAAGVFGVFSADVAQRRREIGIRMALGSSGLRVIAMLTGRALRYAAAGTMVGAAMAIALARAMSTLLFGVNPSDPIPLASVAAVVLMVAAAATLPSALRAVRGAPLSVLREG